MPEEHLRVREIRRHHLERIRGLEPIYQDIYRHVAAMESAGIRVHRQLVIRLLGIPADEVSAALLHLADIIHEYTVSEREGIYGWRGRHPVIVSIIARYKYPDVNKVAELFAKVIENTSPTYEIEIRGMRELCNIDSGIVMIPDKSVQNTLLRQMMSIVPGERVPRHRLIRNLIDMGEFEKSETEIRIFENDFKLDGPVARYKVRLLTERARYTVGIMEEDRLAILNQAATLASNAIQRFPHSKTILEAYCEVGIEIYKRSGDRVVFDMAIAEFRAAEERIGDPGIARTISRYESRIQTHSLDAVEVTGEREVEEEET